MLCEEGTQTFTEFDWFYQELSGLNNYYMDAEEKVVIRLQALEAQLNQVQETKDEELLQSMKAALIDFHGIFAQKKSKKSFACFVTGLVCP